MRLIAPAKEKNALQQSFWKFPVQPSFNGPEQPEHGCKIKRSKREAYDLTPVHSVSFHNKTITG